MKNIESQDIYIDRYRYGCIYVNKNMYILIYIYASIYLCMSIKKREIIH